MKRIVKLGASLAGVITTPVDSTLNSIASSILVTTTTNIIYCITPNQTAIILNPSTVSFTVTAITLDPSITSISDIDLISASTGSMYLYLANNNLALMAAVPSSFISARTKFIGSCILHFKKMITLQTFCCPVIIVCMSCIMILLPQLFPHDL